ncbi:MAG: glycosyltransferase family 4 protein [bacterium]
MKILLVNKYYYLRGGTERYFFDLKNLLEKNGHTVISFSMTHEKNEQSEWEKYFADEVDFESYKVREVLFNIIKIFYNWDAVKKLRVLIKEENPDIAHLHNIAHHLSPAIIWTLKKYNIPIVQTLHDYKAICPAYLLFRKEKECSLCSGGKFYNCFFKKCIKNSRVKSFLIMCEAYFHNMIIKTYNFVDLFIAPTNFVKNTCVKFGIKEERIKVVRGFLAGTVSNIEYKVSGKIDKDDYVSSPLEGGRGGSKREIGVLESGYLLYFGRLSREKGIYVLLDAIQRVDDCIKLKIVGDGPEKKNLEFRIKNYELRNKVEITDARYGEELKEIIREAAAIIVPSICPESMCYSLIEAMALGKIVIASSIGGMKEFIKDKRNGFLFEPGNSKELGERINTLFATELLDPLMGLIPLDASDISRRAKETVSRLTPQKHYEEIMKIYNKLIG